MKQKNEQCTIIRLKFVSSTLDGVDSTGNCLVVHDGTNVLCYIVRFTSLLENEQVLNSKHTMLFITEIYRDRERIRTILVEKR